MGITFGISESNKIIIMETQNTNAKEIEDLELETLEAIYSGKKETVKKLCGKTEQLFIKGSEKTRSLIINKFFVPLSRLLEMNYSWGREYLGLLPSQFKAESYKQN